MLLLLSLFASVGQAQDSTRALSLEELIRTATTANASLQLARMDEAVAAANYKETEAMYLPQVSFSYSLLNSNDPLNAFAFKLQGKSIAAADFNPDALNHPSGRSDFVTQLNLRQPLVNIDMLYQRKAAAQQKEIYRYKTQRTKEMIIFQSQQAFLQLQLAYAGRRVLEEAAATLQSLRKFTGDRYEQGLLQQSDLLNVEVQLKTLETAIAETKSQIQNASDQISLLMNQPLGTTYLADSTVFTAPVALPPVTIPAARADFKAMGVMLTINKLLIRSNKMSFMPRLNFFANYQLHDAAPLNFGAGAYLAGLQLSWDIFKGHTVKNKTASLQRQNERIKAGIEQQQAADQLALQKASRDVADAAFRIRQQEAAITAASEALRILQNRYAQGLVTTTDVLTAHNQVAQQRLGLTQALFSRNMALAYWQFLTASNK